MLSKESFKFRAIIVLPVELMVCAIGEGKLCSMQGRTFEWF